MNILFITADQWRWECLSALDHPVVKTPNLDALAAEGVIFTNHFAQATPCSPSRTSLHTGRYLQNHRCVVNGAPVESRFTNWALEVGKLGYQPSLFGYTDTAVDPRGLDPQDPRMTHYSEPLPGLVDYTPFRNDVPMEWVEYLKKKNHPMPAHNWDLYAVTEPGVDWAAGGERILPLAMNTEDHETHYMVNRCIDWIGKKDKPWVTHLSLLRPHPPFASPAPYNSMYAPQDMVEPNRLHDPQLEAVQHPLIDYFINHSKFRAPDSIRQTQQDMVNYYGLITEVDDNLGRLFEFLKARGEWDNTLIIVTSDHGEQLGDHWLMYKLGFYDQSYHIPLIVRDPRAEADVSRGKRFDQFTENVDIMPTMLSWLGTDVPIECDGHSLLPFIYQAKKPAGWRDEVHWECDFRRVEDPQMEQMLGVTLHQCSLTVIRDHDFKYVHFAALPPLLYDLRNDPGEFVNQATNPDYQATVLHYAQKMLSWKMNYNERGLSHMVYADSGPITRHSPVRHVEHHE